MKKETEAGKTHEVVEMFMILTELRVSLSPAYSAVKAEVRDRTQWLRELHSLEDLLQVPVTHIKSWVWHCAPVAPVL